VKDDYKVAFRNAEPLFPPLAPEPRPPVIVEDPNEARSEARLLNRELLLGLLVTTGQIQLDLGTQVLSPHIRTRRLLRINGMGQVDDQSNQIKSNQPCPWLTTTHCCKKGCSIGIYKIPLQYSTGVEYPVHFG